MQSQKSVESFGWQWTQQTVIDSKQTFHRRLFHDCGIWFDYLDGKVVADVCSGNGRYVWAIKNLTKACRIISVELDRSAATLQKELFQDDNRIQVLQADAGQVSFLADFVYMVGAIQHVQNPKQVLTNIMGNIKDQGELVVSFYLKTPTTLALRPIRFLTKRLPKKMLWMISPLLAPIFMVRRAGRDMGFTNARHTAYDWFGSHEYQYYFTEPEIMDLFKSIGIEDTNIIRLKKGLYKVRKGKGIQLEDTVYSFGGTS